MKGKWTKEAIVEFGDVISGGTPSTNVDEFWNGEIVWITPADLSKSKYPTIDNSLKRISKKGLSNSSANLIPKGSIVMSSRAPIGYFAVPSVDYSTNQGCKSIKLRGEHEPMFHYYNFIHNVEEFKSRGEGTTFAEISKKEIEKVEVSFPPSPHQRKIAKILTTCDAVLEQTEATIAKYQAIKQGMMHDLFTRGIDLETGKLRPKYEDAPELYKESQLGWIPKEWEVKRLDDFGEIYYGKDYKANLPGDEIPIYGTGGIMGFTSIKLNKGPAVLTGRKGSINNPIYVEGDFWNVDTIFCIKIFEGTNIKWFYNQLKSRDLAKLNEATGVPSVSSKALYSLLFLCPKEEEQLEVRNRLDSIDIKIQAEQSILQKYRQIKAGLMQDLLSGKVEVSVEEKD